MGISDFLFAKKREDELMQKKASRMVAIAVSFTPAEELEESDSDIYGKAVFKIKKGQGWVEYEVDVKEKIGKIVPGDQWIVKFDEDFTRIIAPQLKLSKDSLYRIADSE